MTFGRVALTVVAWLAVDLLIVALLTLRAWRLGRFKKEAR
jgi:hypothetical protein